MIMREELKDFELDQVTGGTVIFSNIYNAVAFSTLRQKYSLKCNWKTARNFVEELLEAHPEMSEAAFDAFAKEQLDAMNYLGDPM